MAAAMVRMGSTAPSTAPRRTSRPICGSMGSSARALPIGVRDSWREGREGGSEEERGKDGSREEGSEEGGEEGEGRRRGRGEGGGGGGGREEGEGEEGGKGGREVK